MPSVESLVVSVISCSVVAATMLAILGCRLARKMPSIRVDAKIGPPQVTIVIPSLGGGKQLRLCFEALKRNMPACVSKVIVSLQQVSQTTEREIQAAWQHSVALEVCEIKGRPSKSVAISLALRSVHTEWVLLLDSDAQVSSELHKLLEYLDDADAAYGMLLPVEQNADTFLNCVVKADKVVSHAVWRLGRFAAGLWPNLPGQCYAIRCSLLRSIYDETMGHLDDMAVTLRLAARRSRVRFVPVVVSFEEGRSTWGGLISQRARWSIGLVQSLTKIHWLSKGAMRSVACWMIHAWLYFGWPLFTCGVSLAFYFVGRPLFALGIAIAFLASWSLLVVAGNRVFSLILPNYIPVKWATSAFPASCVIMLAQTLGFVSAPGFLAIRAIKPLFGNRALYKR